MTSIVGAPVLVWVEVRGFRAFGTEARRLDLDAPLVVVHAGNSQGKSSLAEALEFLLVGRSSRRDLLGGAKAEYNDSLRNAHLPSEEQQVYVAAGVRGSDDVVHEVRRELTCDFAAGTDCRSRLLVDGREETSLAALGLTPTDPPLSAPVLLQHTLRYVLSTEPKQRVSYFKALLTLTDLDQLRQRVTQAAARFEQSPVGPAVAAARALLRTPLAETGRALLGVDGTDVVGAATAVRKILLEAARLATGMTSADLESLTDNLREAVARHRDSVFPLRAFDPGAQVPDDPAPLDLTRYAQALRSADRAAASLAPMIAAVLSVSAYQDLAQPVECPVCATPEALTPARLAALREQMRRTGAVDEAVAAALAQVGQSRAIVGRLRDAMPDGVPASAEWTPEQVGDAGRQLDRLGVPRDALSSALRVGAYTNATAQVARQRCEELLVVLADAETCLQRRDDISPDIQEGHRLLVQALEALRASRHASDAAAVALRERIDPVIQARTAAAGLAELRTALVHADGLVAELRSAAARARVADRLAAAEKALRSAAGTVLDTRFGQMSGAIERWWLTIRPEELVGFAGVKRRAGGALFVNLVAALRSDPHAEPVQRDALGVFSDSQLNALGLATFLARVQLLAVPLVVLDDPIPGSDSDHRLTFVQNTLAALLDEGQQVILTTFDHKLAEWAASQHSHREHITYELTLADPIAGIEPTQTSDTFNRLLLEAEDNLNSPSPSGRRGACNTYRSAAERLAKQVIATGRTIAGQPCSVSDVESEAKILGDLVPLVRGFARDNTEKGNWNTFAKVLNPGSHDDDVPSTIDLRQVRGNLRKIAKAHSAHWPGGLVR